MGHEEPVRILIADALSATAVTALEQLGAKVTVNASVKAEELPAHIGDAEILVVRSTKVTAAAVDAASSLSLIIRAGAGVNTIDVAAATRRGIHVANCPGKNSNAVAELAIGLLIAADRSIVNATVDVRAGKWRKKLYGEAAGLRGRTLGIVGLGAIGRAVAECAHGLGMKVIGWSRSLTPETAEELGIRACATPLELAARSDAVSVHLAVAPETERFIGAAFFDAMKSGAIFVNTSRGEIVDHEALRSAVEKKSIRAALDVFDSEPAGGDAVFADTALANLVSAATPHIGASTEQSADAIASEVVRIVRVYLETGKPPQSVNVREKSAAPNSLVVRHFNRVGVLASVLDVLKEAGINIEEMENTIFGGEGVAASCTLRLDERPTPQVIARLRDADNIIQVSLK